MAAVVGGASSGQQSVLGPWGRQPERPCCSRPPTLASAASGRLGTRLPRGGSLAWARGPTSLRLHQQQRQGAGAGRAARLEVECVTAPKRGAAGETFAEGKVQKVRFNQPAGCLG